ncbi:MAG: dihydrodipicolinate synthase family protein, partial [Bacteroidales bacterium]|nr:dihydrodipicolinate synthase family protein [Bacteroidales bacterium]
IKEASGNLEQIYKIIDNRPEGFVVLSGNDDQTLDIMRHGGDGVISVASNISPFLVKRLVDSIWSDDAEKINNQLMPLFKACFMESNPIPVKAALSAIGLIENELRLPLTTCEPETMETMKAILDELELL